MELKETCDPGSAGRLAKQGLLGGDESVSREDLLIGHRVDEATGFIAGGDREIP